MKSVRCLNANLIKIIALVCMIFDHIGFMLFPKVLWLRSIGRVAFPLFAYMIYNGCKYTKNKLKHFLLIFGCGVIFQIFYALALGFKNDFNVFLTFSVSVLLIYAIKWLVGKYGKNRKLLIICIIAYIFLLFGVWLLCEFVVLDYGFWGLILPVVLTFTDFIKFQKIQYWLVLIIYATYLCITPLFSPFKYQQFYALFALPIIALYNEKRGKYNLKYFFYVAYPVHLAIIYAIGYIIL